MGPLRFTCLLVLSAAVFGFQAAHGAMPPEAAQAVRTGDFAKAHRLLAPLGRAGDEDALYQIGRMYALALGVNASSREAFGYYTRSADLGHVEAAYLVGSLYEKGEGVALNLAEAQSWYQVAASAGHKRAQRKVRTLQVNADTSNSINRAVIASSAAEGFAVAVSACDAKSLDGILGAVNGRDRIRLLEDNPLALHKAIDCPQATILRLLVSIGGPLDIVDEAGNTPLHLAVARGEDAKAEFLLGNGASVALENEAGWTPRMLAERSGDEMLGQLLGVEVRSMAGSMATLRSAQRSAVYKGWSALAIAAWKGDVDLVQVAIDAGGEINGVDATGRSALYRAIDCDNADVVRLLLQSGADAGDPSLLHLAFDRQRSEIAQMLIRQGADIGARDLNGQTALYRAVGNGDEASVVFLLNAGGIDVDARHDKGETSLMLAAREGSVDLVGQLLSNGADVTLSDLSGCTALCWALKAGHERVAQTLIFNAANNLPDNDGVTPMMLAARAGYLSCVQMLVEGGGDVNAQSKSGSHALMLASTQGHERVVDYLLQQGSQIDLANIAGDTALVAAVRHDHKIVASKLLDMGASANARNKRFESAISLAKAKPDVDWTTMFEDGGIW